MSSNGAAAGLGRIQRLGKGKGRRGGRRTVAGGGRDARELRGGARRGGVRVVRASGVPRGARGADGRVPDAQAAVGAREGASARTVREGRAPRYKSVATRIRKLSSRAFQLLHSVTSSSPRNAQDAGVVIPFRKLKSKHDFSMSQGPMWQFLPPYLVAQDVHVHAVVVPPTVPPLMQ